MTLEAMAGQGNNPIQSFDGAERVWEFFNNLTPNAQNTKK
jgi:hypothetical protein